MASDDAAVLDLPALADVHDDVWMPFVECINPLLAGLNDADREAITLVDLQGASQAQVARDLGMSNSGLKSRVQRARQKMRSVLDECCEIEIDARGRPIGIEPRDADCDVDVCE